VIDAGSSGLRIYVYKVEPGNDRDMPIITLVGGKKVNPEEILFLN